VKQLCRLWKLRTYREISVFGNFVIRNQIFTIRLAAVSTYYHEVTYRVERRLSVKNLKSFNVPFYNFRRHKVRGIGVSFSITLGVEWAEARFLNFTMKCSFIFNNWNSVKFS